MKTLNLHPALAEIALEAGVLLGPMEPPPKTLSDGRILWKPEAKDEGFILPSIEGLQGLVDFLPFAPGDTVLMKYKYSRHPNSNCDALQHEATFGPIATVEGVNLSTNGADLEDAWNIALAVERAFPKQTAPDWWWLAKTEDAG